MLFIGVLLFLFFSIIRPQDYVTLIKGLPVIYVTIGILSVGLLLKGKLSKCFQNPIDYFILLFYVIVVISTAKVAWISYTKDTIIDFGKIIIIYFYIKLVLDSYRKYKIAFWTIVGLMSLVAVFGILQFYGFDVSGIGMLYSPDKQSYQIRYAGLFDNPNDMAYSTIIVIVFCVALIFSTTRPSIKFFMMIPLVIVSYSIYLTRSRGGQLAFLAGSVATMYYSITNKYAKKLIFIVGISSVVFVMLSSHLMRGVVDYQSDESAMVRIDAWAKGMELLRDNPVIGVGYQQYIEYFKRDSHSSYVRAFSELGLMGIFIWVGIIYFNFKISNSYSPSDDLKFYKIATRGFLFAYIVGSMVSTRTYDVFFVIVSAIISSGRQLEISNTEGTLSPDRVTLKDLRNISVVSALIILTYKIFVMKSY